MKIGKNVMRDIWKMRECETQEHIIIWWCQEQILRAEVTDMEEKREEKQKNYNKQNKISCPTIKIQQLQKEKFDSRS